MLLLASPILWTLSQLLTGPKFARPRVAARGEVGEAVLCALAILGEATVRDIAAQTSLPYDCVRQSLYRLRARRLAQVIRRERLATGHVDVWAVSETS